MNQKLQLPVCIIIMLLCNAGVYTNAQGVAMIEEMELVNYEEKQTLKAMLERFEINYHVSIAYKSELVENQEVDGTIIFSGSLEQDLSRLLKPYGLQLTKVREDFHVIEKKKLPRPQVNVESKETVATRSPISNLAITVRGQVTSQETGEAISGVTITVKETSIKTATDANGNYSLEVPDNAAVLVFSFIGFDRQEVSVNNRTLIDVALIPNTTSLDEVVVVGYGEMKSSDISSSIATVQSDQLSPTTTNFTQGLQGKVAGLSAVQTTGQPGGGMEIKIRDNPSFASAGVLYVVDGVPINEAAPEAGTLSQYNNFNVDRSPLNFLNTNDIESISVLKDASATAIYGARAGAGVVLITTKKGASGKPTINYNNNFSFKEAVWYHDLLDTKSYMVERNRILKEAWMNANDIAPYGENDPSIADDFKPLYTPEEIANTPYREPVLNAISRNASTTQHNLAVSGGVANTTYYISGNYLSDNGVVGQSNFKRYGGRLRIENSISDNVNIGVNVMYNRSDSNNPMGGGEEENASEGGIISSAYRFPANLPFKDAEGNYTENPDNTLSPNPLSFLEIDDNTNSNRLLGTGHISWDILPSLTAEARFTYDESKSLRGLYLPNSFYYGRRTGGLASISNQESFSKSTEGTLNYSTNLGDNTRLRLLAGYSYKRTTNQGLTGVSTNYVTDVFSYHNMSAGRMNVEANSSKYVNVWASYFGRAVFNWGHFNVTGSIRRDGSSNFAKNKKYGLFPAVSASYNLAELSFFKENLTFVNALKPRIGYGVTGNSEIGSNAFSIYSTGVASDNFYHNYVFGTTENVGVFWQQVNNDELTWETVKSYNLGLDFDVLGGRIDGSLDYFNKTIEDLLSFRPLPTHFPVSTVASNVGKTRTTGWEVAVNSRNIIPGDSDGFSWRSNFTLAHYASYWVERSPEVLKTLQPYIDPQGLFNARHGYKTSGIYTGKEEAPAWMPDIIPGTIIIQDLNGYDAEGQLTGVPDGQISSADITFIGSNDPKLSFGINNEFSYKQFDVSIYAYGLVQKKYNSIYAQSFSTQGTLGSTGGNILREAAANRWSYDNQGSKFPSGLQSRYSGYLGGSDYWFEDGSFIRIAHITLGYTLPSSLLAKQNVFTNAKINLRFENPFLFTDYRGGDPELGSTMPYPNTRNIVFGVNVAF